MKTKTLKRFNLLTVLLLVIAIAITCCAFFISSGVKSVIDNGSGKQVDMSILDNVMLSNTNGTLPEGTELNIPDGYTGVAITTEQELKDFITNADVTTLMYGYLAPAEGAGSIGIDWQANGSSSALTANKTLDGRGLSIDLNTVGTSGGNFIRKLETPADSLINKDIRAGGMFVTSNFGTIKNVQFNFAQAVSFKCNQEWTTTYGIIAGYNAGVIDNVSLDIKSGATFKVDKNEPAVETTETDRCTVLVGGITGLNGSATAGLGVIKNTKVINNGEMWAQARYKGKKGGIFGIGAVEGSSRSSIAMLVGRMQGLTSAVENCTVLGAGSISASTTGTANQGSLLRHTATAVASNSAWSGTQDNAFGTINGIIDAYAGRIDGSNSGAQGGTVDCFENIFNIYRPMARSNAKKLMNCACDHNKLNTYRTLESKSVALNYGFAATNGEVEYSTALTDEDKAANLQLFKHSTSTSTVSNYIAAPTHTVVADYTANVNTDTVGILTADTSDSKTFGSVETSYYNELEMTLSNQSSDSLTYTGNAQVPIFDVALANKATGASHNVVAGNIKHVYLRDGESSSASILTGNYKVEVKDTANLNVAYYEEIDGKVYAAKYVDANCNLTYSIVNATITANAPTSGWHKEFAYDIDMTGFASGAIDNLKYTTDNGATWVDVVGTRLNVATVGSAVVHKIVGYKGTVQVTEEYTASAIDFDNVGPTIGTITYDKPIETWTVENVTATFSPEDSLSGIATVTVKQGATDITPTIENLTYSFVMDGNLEYTITATDNLGNVSTHNVTPKIDKTNPTITLAATYYKPDGEKEYVAGEKSYTPITITITNTVGVSGATVYVAIKDESGNITSWENIAAVSGNYSRRYVDVTDETVTFKVVNGAGVEVTADMAIVISKHEITITNDNLDFTNTVYEKTYDTTNTITGSVGLKDLLVDGSVIDEVFEGYFSITATYDNKNAGIDKAVNYQLNVNADYKDEFIINNQLQATNNGVINKQDVVLTINKQTRQFYDANPAAFDYSLVGVLNDEYGDIRIGHEFVLEYDVTANSSVGKYNIKFVSQSATNYNIALASENEGNEKFEITRRDVIVEFKGYEGLTYNGLSQSLQAFFTDIDNVQRALEVTYDKNPLNAGTYVATAHFPEDSNYKNSIESDSWTFKIAKRTIAITSENIVTDYDGTAKSITCSTEFNTPVTVKYNGSQEAPINAGRYAVEFIVEGNENFNAVTKEALLTINKIDYTGSVVFNGKTVTYNGEVQSLVVENAPDGTIVSYTNNDQVNVGTYNVKAVITNVNYNDITVEAVLTINQKVFNGLTFEDKTVVYDGNEHSLVVNGAPEDAVITYSPNNGRVNAGESIVEVTISGDNYIAVTLRANLTVKKAKLPTTIVFDEEESEFGFDGQTHTFTLLGDLTGFNVVYTNNVVKDVGVTFVKAYVTSQNYEDTYVTISVIVKAYEVVVTYTGLPNSGMLKPGEKLPTITASFTDIDGNLVEVETNSSGNLSVDGYIKVSAILPRNYIGVGGTDYVYIDVDESTGPSTAVIVGASVGGSVGGLAVIGGIIAFFVIKKKKSIV